MSRTNSPLINDNLLRLAKQFKNVGKQLVLAQSIDIEIHDYVAECIISETKPIGILEEFVLRAAIEIQPPLHWRQLANLLQVDDRFIQDTKSILEQMKTLDKSDFLTVTEHGQKSYKDGAIISERSRQIVHLIDVPILPDIIALAELERSETESDVKTRIREGDRISSLSRDEIIEVIKRSDLNIDNEFQDITACELKKPTLNELQIDICIYYNWLANELEWYFLQSEQIPSLPTQNCTHYIDTINNFDKDEVYRLFQQSFGFNRYDTSWLSLVEILRQSYVDSLLTEKQNEMQPHDGILEIIDNDVFLLQKLDSMAVITDKCVLIKFDAAVIRSREWFYEWLTTLLGKSLLILLIVDDSETYQDLLSDIEFYLRMPDDVPILRVLLIDVALPFFCMFDGKDLITHGIASMNHELSVFFRSNISEHVREATLNLYQNLDLESSSLSILDRLNVQLNLVNLAKTEPFLTEDLVNSDEFELIRQYLLITPSIEIIDQVFSQMLQLLDSSGNAQTEVAQQIERILYLYESDENKILIYDDLVSKHQDKLVELGIITQ